MLVLTKICYQIKVSFPLPLLWPQANFSQVLSQISFGRHNVTHVMPSSDESSILMRLTDHNKQDKIYFVFHMLDGGHTSSSYSDIPYLRCMLSLIKNSAG